MKTLLSIATLTILILSCGQMSGKGDTDNNGKEAHAPEAEAGPAGSGYNIGDAATDFSLKNVDGKMVSLTDFNNAKGYIVVFTCNHCPYAKAYEDRIIALDKKYASKGYPVIAISPNDPALQPEDSYEKMQERAREKQYSFPYLIDEKQDIYPQYGATKTPHVFILQKESGKNIVKYIGAIDDNYEDPDDVSKKYVETAVDALIAGKEVPETKTVAIGCSIKDKRNKK